MDIKKTVILGTFAHAQSRKIGRYYSPLTVKVEIEYGRDKLNPDKVKPRLSICGTVYRPGARDIESGGQILEDVRALLNDSAAHLNKPREQIARLLEIWDRWHLNDMRPGCEHQRASWNPQEKIQLVTYKLTSAALVRAHTLTQESARRLAAGDAVQYTASEQHIANLPYNVVRGAEEPAPGPEYEESARETKAAGWVQPGEHPRGLLCKRCPVCGYSYGSAWLYEEVPADVVKFLEDF